MKWGPMSRVPGLGHDKGGYQFPAPSPNYSNPYLRRMAVDIDDIILRPFLHHRLVCQILELEKISKDLRL